ncbi:hypothetical protein Acr_29g0006100 [Actinidia rufa]|uniref:Uncharacterized protein n=1 Tax=Actinidia rufa TaxID=165716 RepID=A0A7J0HEG7_9ERIC|nr:hypothetical protein Acr_29g0006100 [Actinidia rufa]
MSKRLKLSDLAKVVAQKATTSASKGVVISEGSETTSAPARPPIASGGGSSVKRTLGESFGPQASVMASAATAEKNSGRGDTPGGQGEGGYLRVFSRRSQQGFRRRVPLLRRRRRGRSSPRTPDARDKVIARLEARISELERSQSLTQGRIIAAFKESDDFLEAVRGSASSYFGDGFDFCKRQIAHQYPDLGVDLEDIEMDHEFLAKEEAEAEKRAAEEGTAGVEGVGEAVV